MDAKLRRTPRRSFESNVGVLHRGEYAVARSYQVGEGGMMFSASQVLEIGQLVVATFYIQSETLVMVRGIVRSVVPAKGKLPLRFGIEFQNLEFQARREIRNFVAEATRNDTTDL